MERCEQLAMFDFAPTRRVRELNRKPQTLTYAITTQ